MVVAVTATPNHKVSGPNQIPKRTPLLPSEANNGVVGNRRPKSREVTSRYLSSSTPSSSSTSTSTSSSNSSSSRRYPTPMTPAAVKRSQSAERRRPTTPRNAGEMSAAAKLLVTSTRSVSVSFQGDSFSLAISKKKPAPASTAPSSLNSSRKATPERRKATPARDQSENSKPIFDQHRWPGRSRDLNSLTRSLDCTVGKKKSGGSGSAVRASQQHSMIEQSNKVNNGMTRSFIDSPISSPRGVSSSRGLSSPLRGGVIRPASPSKLMTSSASSPSRGMQSPSRVRNGVASVLSSSNNLSNTPSILGFGADVRRGKVGENRIVDAHLLRLLYNRHLQWRFINARSDAAMLVQKVTAEKILYNAWVNTLKLRHSVKSKRVELQLLQKNLKLYSILKGQMPYLDDWDLIEKDHSSSLSGAIQALEASTLRLPVVGARADIQHVKDAICSAVDVMQAMASSICSLLTKVDQVNSLVSELANITTNERALLNQCKDLLSTLTATQVNNCSLRTHILQQLKCVPTSLTTEVLKS